MHINMGNLAAGTRRFLIIWFMVVGLLLSSSPAQAQAVSANTVSDAAMKLLDFAVNAKAPLDGRAVDVLVDYVLETKSIREVELPKIRKATGAYYEFDTGIDFTRFLQYSYSSQVPSALTSPASLRYSLWSSPDGESQKLPESWKLPAPDSPPVVIRGFQRDGITPDLTTGVYYEYNLRRTLVLLNHKGRHVLISISQQTDVSDVGRKGFILGYDDDWNYHYTPDIGSAKAGLGWVKSYIYDFFSVGVYVEASATPSQVRSGMFQWIRAGWSGINFVQTEHMIKGMKRHAQNSKSILESPRLPEPAQIVEAYRRLCTLSQKDLMARYAALHQARHDLAVAGGKIGVRDAKKQDALIDLSREQIIEALMLEHFKVVLGKSSLLGKKLARVGH
ncbi:MAG: hypothetical protein R6W75_00605 [Smithellaceae bacterium]